MSILILGGTKFLGPDIVEAAVAAGHKVTLFNRGKTNPGLFPDLETLIGDRDGQLDALKGRKWDAVIDTSGYVPRVVKQSVDLLAPNVGQYVFVSTISVYADPLAANADESAPLAKLDDPASEDVPKYYGALKAACERTVEAGFPGKATNVRPGLIVGPGDPSDRFTYWPARMDRGGEVLAPGDGTDLGQVIDARDLGAWLVKCVVDRTVGTFNAVGPAEPMTMKTMLDACNQAAGNQATLTWVPTKFLEEKEVQPWMELPVWTGGDLGFCTVRSDKAKAAGLTFRSIDDTAKATLEWWRAQPDDAKAKPKAGLAPDKEAAVLAAWKRAFDEGHEIGNHTVSHTDGGMWTAEQWKAELQQADQLLQSIAPGQVTGFRTPFLSYNDAVLGVVDELGFCYDSSIEEGYEYDQDGTNYFWPYTLDNRSPGHSVQVEWGLKVEINKHPGLWLMPTYAVIAPPDDRCEEYGVPSGLRARLKERQTWFDVAGGKITGFDYNLWAGSAEGGFGVSKAEFLAITKYTFDLRLQGNKAPFLLGAHSAYYVDAWSPSAPNATTAERRAAIEELLDYAQAKGATVTSYKAVLDWVRNPSVDR